MSEALSGEFSGLRRERIQKRFQSHTHTLSRKIIIDFRVLIKYIKIGLNDDKIKSATT